MSRTGAMKLGPKLKPEDEEEFDKMAKSGRIHEMIAQSIAPSMIYVLTSLVLGACSLRLGGFSWWLRIKIDSCSSIWTRISRCEHWHARAYSRASRTIRGCASKALGAPKEPRGMSAAARPSGRPRLKERRGGSPHHVIGCLSVVPVPGGASEVLWE